MVDEPQPGKIVQIVYRGSEARRLELKQKALDMGTTVQDLVEIAVNAYLGSLRPSEDGAESVEDIPVPLSLRSDVMRFISFLRNPQNVSDANAINYIRSVLSEYTSRIGGKI